MSTTWIVIGHRAGARIFEHKRPNELRLVSEIEHEQGRLENQAFDADRPGRAFDRHGAGRHAMGVEEPPHERVAAAFARQVGDVLNTARNQNRFDELVIVAEPRFLGMLRTALDHVTASRVSSSVSKDLANVAAHDLPQHLSDVIRI